MTTLPARLPDPNAPFVPSVPAHQPGFRIPGRRIWLATALSLFLLPLAACESEIGVEPPPDPGTPHIPGPRLGIDSLQLAIVLENPGAIFGQQLDLRLQARNPTQDTIAFSPIALMPSTMSWLLDAKSFGPYPISQWHDGTMLTNAIIDLPPGASFVAWSRLNPLWDLPPSELLAGSRHRFKVALSSRATASSIDTAWEFAWEPTAADLAILDATHRYLASGPSDSPSSPTDFAARAYIAIYHDWDSSGFLRASPLSHYAYATLEHAQRLTGYQSADYAADHAMWIRSIAIDPALPSIPAQVDAKLACSPIGVRTDSACPDLPKLATRIERIFGKPLARVEQGERLLELVFSDSSRAYSPMNYMWFSIQLRFEFMPAPRAGI